jgi:hypothetical protein
MTLEQRMYRDPLQILLEDEAKTCKGCKHEHRQWLWGNLIKLCTKKKPDGKRRNYGARCKDYQGST